MSTIQANGGQVQSNDNMIIWDPSQVPQLKHLDAQQQGEVDFSVKVKNNWAPSGSDSSNDGDCMTKLIFPKLRKTFQ